MAGQERYGNYSYRGGYRTAFTSGGIGKYSFPGYAVFRLGRDCRIRLVNGKNSGAERRLTTFGLRRSSAHSQTGGSRMRRCGTGGARRAGPRGRCQWACHATLRAADCDGFASAFDLEADGRPASGPARLDATDARRKRERLLIPGSRRGGCNLRQPTGVFAAPIPWHFSRCI